MNSSDRGAAVGALEPLTVLFWFTRDTLLTASSYIVLWGVTLVLGGLADLATERVHKMVLVFLERAIFAVSSIAAFIFIVYTLYNFLRDLSWGIRRLSFAGNQSSVETVDDSIGIVRAKEEIATLPIQGKNLWYAVAVSAVLLLGMLGALRTHQRQVEGLERAIKAQRSMAIDNFIALCRADNGNFNVRALTCELRDGRILSLRLINADMTSP